LIAPFVSSTQLQTVFGPQTRVVPTTTCPIFELIMKARMFG